MDDSDGDIDDIYRISSEGPLFQIPNDEQPPDPDKMFAIDNCGDYLGKVSRDLQETIKIQEKRKKKSYEKKDVFMREGNKAFRERDYKKALKNYNKAIDLVMDSCVLYTNRAMTYLKLGKPRQALVDASSALYWNPENLKALIYKAQALYMMGDVMESDLIVAKACEIHPGKTDTIKNPVTGAHTQTVESLWAAAKRRNKRESRTRRSLFDSYLCDLVWRRHEGENLFKVLLKNINDFYTI